MDTPDWVRAVRFRPRGQHVLILFQLIFWEHTQTKEKINTMGMKTLAGVRTGNFKTLSQGVIAHCSNNSVAGSNPVMSTKTIINQQKWLKRQSCGCKSHVLLLSVLMCRKSVKIVYYSFGQPGKTGICSHSSSG